MAHRSRSSPSNSPIFSQYSSGIARGLRSPEVDEDEGLLRGHHQHVVVVLVGGELVAHARAPDPRDADEDLDQVVEAGRREVLDRVRAHDELVLARARLEQAEVTVVLDPRGVEVGQVAAVVDDPLRVGVGEADARERRVLERRLAVGHVPELDRHALDHLEDFVALALHQLLRARLEVQAQEGLRVRGPHVHVPVLGVDRDTIQVADPALLAEALLQLLQLRGHVGHRGVQLAGDEVRVSEGPQDLGELLPALREELQHQQERE